MDDPYGDIPQPTDAGRKKWPPSGYYDLIPCTCADDCPPNCSGKCGCQACAIAYGDFLSGQ